MVIVKRVHREEFFFTITSWEIESLRHFHRIVEDNLDELLQKYAVSDDQELKSGARLVAELGLMHVGARIPALLRIPVITMAWSLYEACVVEVSRFFETKLDLEYSLATSQSDVPTHLQKRWGKWNTLKQARYFFAEELDVPLVADASDEASLNDLRQLRNMLVHSGGRRPPTQRRKWDRLTQISNRTEGLDLETGFVVATADYVRNQMDLVDRTSRHLVGECRRIVAERRLYD
jgi:hypothetical protein